MTNKQIEGYWVIWVQYDSPYGIPCTILSRHKSYAAAEKKLNKSYPGDFCKITYIS